MKKDANLLLDLNRRMEVAICNSMDAFRFGSEKQIAECNAVTEKIRMSVVIMKSSSK